MEKMEKNRGCLGAMSGYDGSLAVQSGSAITAIKLMYNAAPLVIIVIALLVSYKYDLEKQLPVIRKEIAERETIEQ